MSLRILAACSPGEMRVAVADGDHLLAYGIDRPGKPDGVGDIHRGRIRKQMPALGGSFVAITGAEGFLPTTDLTEGNLTNVRVIRAAQGGKGPRLALDPHPATGDARLLAPGPSRLLEFAAAHPAAPIELDDPAAAVALRPQFGDRTRLVAAAFPESIAAALDALEQPDIAFPGGMRLRIHPTPALVAIDIDFDGAVRAGKAAAQMAANLAILPALATQIRLRDLSGAILIDFAGLPARKRQALRPALEAALATDPLTPRLLGFTHLGLAEIVRPRIHPALHEVLAGPHAAGLRALRAIDRMVRADPSAQPALRAAPAVVAALQEDPVALPTLAARLFRPLVLRSDPNLRGDSWTLERTA